AVRAPVALELAGVRIEDHDPLVAIAVRDVRLVVRIVDRNLRDLPEREGVVAVPVAPLHAELLHELPGLRELQDLAVVGAVAADPDVSFLVYGDAVVRLRPLVALPGSAPVPDQVAGRVELEHGRRALAALAGGRRFQLHAFLVVAERGRAAVDDPDV